MSHAAMRLGKAPAKHDPRTLRLARYIAALPPPPARTSWADVLPADLGVMLNDRLGDCTCAGMAHARQVWTANNGAPMLTTPDETVQRWYQESCGYDPADPSSDQGGVEVDVLRYFRKLGIIDAFAAIDPKNRDHMRAAIWLFGGAYIGVSLPVSAQVQDVWHLAVAGTDGDPTPGSWGGHCVYVVDYDQTGLTCITWGQRKRMAWEWWDAYCDEAFALLSRDWADDDGAPSGFDLAALQSDLAAVTG